MTKIRFARTLAVALLFFLSACTFSPAPDTPGLTPTSLPGLLSPLSVGNVFLEGERVAVRVSAQGDRLRWELRDIRGTLVLAGEQPARHDTLTLRLPKGERGFYRLVATDLRGASALASAETTVAVLTPFDFSSVSPDASIFAAQTHFGQFPDIRPEYDVAAQRYTTPGVPKHGPEMASLLSAAGVRTARDELPWSVVEPPIGETRGVYAFPASYDAYMAALASESIASLTILNYGNRLYDQDSEGVGAIPFTDDGRAGYTAYALALKERYGEHIAEVEVWNEINAGTAPWNRGPCRNQPALNDYAITCHVELFRATYEAVKAASPDTLVTGPAGVTLPYGYLEAIFAKGALGYLDAVTVHPYAPNAGAPEFSYGVAGGVGTSLEDRARQLRDVMARYGGEDKLLYFTELGWPTGTAPNTVSELAQAKYLVRAYALSLAAGVDKFFWYDFVNDGVEPDKREQNFGLIHNVSDPLGAYTPKPGYVAYAVAARHLSGAAFVRRDPAPGGVLNYRFRTPSGDVNLLWVPADTHVNAISRTVALEASGPLTVTDMVGKTRVFTPVEGRVHLTLSGDPVYVVGDLSAVAEPARIRLEPGTPREPLALVVDNTSSTTTLPVQVRLEGELRPYTLVVEPGEVARQPLALSGETGLRTVYADVSIRGRLTAALYRSVYVSDPSALPFLEDAYYGDTFPVDDGRGDSLQGDPPQWDSTGTEAVYGGFAPAQFVPQSVPVANAVNDGTSGALRLAPPANAAVTLTLPVPARRFAAEVDLVPFTENGDGGRNLGLILLTQPGSNFFTASDPVRVRVGVGMLGNANLRVQRGGGNQFTTPVGNLAGYAADSWNRLRLEVDLDAGTIAVSFNGAPVGTYTFANLENVRYLGLDAAPGATGGTGYLDNLVVTPLSDAP